MSILQLDWIEQITIATPNDVRFNDGLTGAEQVAVGGIGRFHAWAISDSFMWMAGGHGDTPAEARAQALAGLMLDINEIH